MDMMSYLMGRNSGGAKKGVKIEVVTELPETGEANVIYLVPKETEDENNVFDEYIWINDDWELIGSTDIDISGKQDTMQFSTMPNASADYLGKIVQYTGTTDANYTNGYFYVCVGTTENDVTTYSWSNVDVQNIPDLSEYLNNSEVIAYELGGINLTLNVNGTISLTNVSARNAVVSAINKHIDKEPFMMCFVDSNKTMAIMFIQRIMKQYGSNVNFYPTFLYLGSNGGAVWFGTNRLIMSFDKTTGLVNSATISDASGYGTEEIIKTNRVLTKTNTDTYTPTANYHPATKKYVDDSIAAAITTTLGGSY